MPEELKELILKKGIDLKNRGELSVADVQLSDTYCFGVA
jgi:hypothetical protein